MEPDENNVEIKPAMAKEKTRDVVPPNALSFEGNMAENWVFFRQKFEIYIKASNFEKISEEEKGYLLLNRIGDKGLRVYNIFQFEESEKKYEYASIVKKFEEKYVPTKNVTYERYKFFTRNKKVNESYDEYITELRRLSDTCEFGQLADGLIKDRLILGITDEAIKTRLLREANLTLVRAAEICRVAEITTKQVREISKGTDGEETAEANVVKKGGIRSGQEISRARASQPGASSHPLYQRRVGQPGASTQSQHHRRSSGGFGVNRNKQISRFHSINNCTRCGYSHDKNKCPAFNQTCSACNKLNHFKRMCRSRVNVVDLEENESENDIDIDTLYINNIKNSICQNKGWYENFILNEKFKVRFKLDTAADVNVLPLNVFVLMGIKMERPVRKLTAADGKEINYLGTCRLNICLESVENDVKNELFYVMAAKQPLLSFKSCIDFNLITRNKRVEQINNINDDYGSVDKILKKYDDVFKGIGSIEGEYKIELVENAVPKVHPPRRVPYPLQEQLKNKLKELEKAKIIVKESGPTEWVNSLVIVPKANKDLRLCIDPRDLNKVIKREHYYIPSLNDVVSKLEGACYFSVVDCSSGFWQINLDERSSKLCTFNTPFGRYRFLRMPYGISSAPEVFQKRIRQIYDNLEGVEIYIDDVLIWGKDLRQHNERLEKVLELAMKNNIRFNLNKCKFAQTEVKYMGHIISKHGLRVDESKLIAIKNMKRPENKKDTERFLGFVNYLNRFIPNFSQITEPLRQLIQKDNEFFWAKPQEEAFQLLKNKLITAPVLNFYNNTDEILISCDASKDGCGSVIMQNGRPIEYASKAFTKTQKAYAQIEKELLSVVHACTKFHQYIFTRKDVTIETDHKPLISIYNKPLTAAPARLQRMLIMLQAYTFKLVYKKGKELILADTLSRAFVNDIDKNFEEKFQDIEVQLCSVIENLPVSEEKFRVLKVETQKDSHLVNLIDIIKEGFPENKTQLKDEFKVYWCYRDELTTANGLIFKNNRILVPKSLRKEMLTKVHLTHLGKEKTKLLARDILFWPGMNNDIENMISSCDICLTLPNNNRKEPLIPHAIPDGPWQKVGVDFFEARNKNYIIVIDYYSKFVEVSEIPSLKYLPVSSVLKKIFARHGIPKIVMSDNGPPFNSAEFQNFSKTWSFKHVTSSPRYPRSNGQVERAVQTIKNIIRKSEMDGTDLEMCLLQYRNTPISYNLPSPAQILFSRRLNSVLPVNNQLLKPKIYPNNVIKNELRQRQFKMKYNYDRGTRPLPQLKKGDKVKVKNFNGMKWHDGVVLKEKENQPRAYIVKLADRDRIVTRNRQHLIKVNSSYNDSDVSLRDRIKDIPEFDIDSRKCDIQNKDYNLPVTDVSIPDVKPKHVSVHNHCSTNRNQNCNTQIVTRHGRVVKPPDRLDL